MGRDIVQGADLSAGAPFPVLPWPRLITVPLEGCKHSADTAPDFNTNLTFPQAVQHKRHSHICSSHCKCHRNPGRSQPMANSSSVEPASPGLWVRSLGKGQAEGSFPVPRGSFSLGNRDREEKEKQPEGDAKERSWVQSRIQVPKGYGKWGKALYSSSGKY